MRRMKDSLKGRSTVTTGLLYCQSKHCWTSTIHLACFAGVRVKRFEIIIVRAKIVCIESALLAIDHFADAKASNQISCIAQVAMEKPGTRLSKGE
ncbi:hypothetical protein AWB76_07360 [Caballeronia temeraria]|uniref:Uncharacterized protein n=1 Tax=Caballeronia temeraria TaxID=1777137 RepID=A0A158DTB6_9BURK|nr:hypothetical protein AWB76_07360 [Caballeronia temeraria]